ncbi:MAG: UvrB/UvrC motif-containing protein [Gemmatimonadota bacterium]|nr:UvrB/UvrC motif-containing protein [Gemmatimonadota bacterium]
MNCEHCGERPAEVTHTEMSGMEEEMKTLHLCSACAALQGLGGPPASPPIADLLAHLGGTQEKTFETDAEACEYCGTRARDFRKTGRLGCPQCYAQFGSQLRELLRRVHGSSQHLGKVYVSSAVDIDDTEVRLATLRRRLERAVEVEDFESAASLRDQIHELTGAS